MSDWYVVANLDDFVMTARRLVFNALGDSKKEIQETDPQELLSITPQDQKEFDTVLTQEESVIISKNILRKQINKKSKEHRYMINDDLMTEVIEALNDRMISNILNSLVNRGVLESAYDSESNDFIFWVKDTDEKNEDKNSESS